MARNQRGVARLRLWLTCLVLWASGVPALSQPSADPVVMVRVDRSEAVDRAPLEKTPHERPSVVRMEHRAVQRLTPREPDRGTKRFLMHRALLC